MTENQIGTIVLANAIAIHKELGPGLLENFYENNPSASASLREIGCAMKEDNKEQKNSPGAVDKELITMFLRMTPEQRITANDNMIRTIIELRNALGQASTTNKRSDSAD